MALNSRGNPALALQVRSITIYDDGRIHYTRGYCLPKKTWPILYGKLLYKMDQDFLDSKRENPPSLTPHSNHVYVTSCETHRRTKTFMLKYRFFLLEKVNIYSLNTLNIVCILPFFYMWQLIMYISYINNCMLILGV